MRARVFLGEGCRTEALGTIFMLYTFVLQSHSQSSKMSIAVEMVVWQLKWSIESWIGDLGVRLGLETTSCIGVGLLTAGHAFLAKPEALCVAQAEGEEGRGSEQCLSLPFDSLDSAAQRSDIRSLE